ncbi:MAG: LysE family transporter [Anaerolineales bacterium]|nr:LysE family transporter [Anaerolineales bacterium]
MMTPLEFFLRGAGLGLTAAGAPGPLQAFLVSESLAGGWRRGLPVILAPLISDAPIILVMTFLLDQLPAAITRGLSVVGGLFVLYLAWGVWRQLREPTAATPAPEARVSSLRRAVAMNLLSPGPYLFWGLVNGPLLLVAWRQSAAHATLFLLGFYGIFLAGMAVMVGVFHQARRLGWRVRRGLMFVSMVVLVVFAGILLRDGLFGA